MLVDNVMDKSAPNLSAPMASAPMQYKEDGSVDWGNMWDNFCVLAQEGGPPHRGDMLQAQSDPNVSSPAYQFAVTEIVRGIKEVSGLAATPSSPGWIAVACANVEMAHWLSEAIEEENVGTRSEAATLFVPVGDYYLVKGEIKNVITAVAKTSHYWQAHLAAEVKQTLAFQEALRRLHNRLPWLRKKPNPLNS